MVNMAIGKQQLAKELGCSVQTVHNLSRKGAIPHVKEEMVNNQMIKHYDVDACRKAIAKYKNRKKGPKQQ